MNKYVSILALGSLLCGALNGETHDARGLVVGVSATHRTVIISCEAIPGYMAPMEMSFKVMDAKALTALTPGSTVRFTIVQRHHGLYADHLAATLAANLEQEPMQAGGLTALNGALSPSSAARLVQPKQSVPDFVLTDQTGAEVHLSQFRGKVVALTFGYSRCPNPEYCYRLSNNLALVEKRFSERAGRDLILLTIAIDPEHDRGEVLKAYAAEWHADPARWHFLTGTVPEIKQVAAMFGMNFWRDEGLLTHSLHTVVIDREGKLAANLEGNHYTAQQLGDLVKAVIDRPS